MSRIQKYIFNNIEIRYYIVLFLIILIGVFMIAAPHFPESAVNQYKNNDAFLAITVLGIFVILPPLIWMILIFKQTTYRDIVNSMNSRTIKNSRRIIPVNKYTNNYNYNYN